MSGNNATAWQSHMRLACTGAEGATGVICRGPSKLIRVLQIDGEQDSRLGQDLRLGGRARRGRSTVRRVRVEMVRHMSRAMCIQYTTNDRRGPHSSLQHSQEAAEPHHLRRGDTRQQKHRDGGRILILSGECAGLNSRYLSGQSLGARYLPDACLLVGRCGGGPAWALPATAPSGAGRSKGAAQGSMFGSLPRT